MLKRQTARPAIWSADWTDGLVDIRETLDWLRLSYDLYEGSDFWTQAEIDDDDVETPDDASEGDLKASSFQTAYAAVGRPYDYDPRIDNILVTAVDLVEYHSGISLFNDVRWIWDVDVEKGFLFYSNKWIELEFPVAPLDTLTEIRVMDPSCDVEGRTDHLVEVDGDDYFIKGDKIFIDKRWSFKSPGKFDMFRIDFTTDAYSDLHVLNNAILKLAAYLYEHAGDEFNSGDPIVESGALNAISRHFNAFDTIFAA